MLFSKKLKESQIFLILAKIFVIFTFWQANLRFYFRENAKANFFVSTLHLSVSYFLATVSFVAVVLAFINILNSLNRFIISLLVVVPIQGLLVVKLPLPASFIMTYLFMRRS
jgi:hypothetical protein